MDYFAHQDRGRRNSVLLLSLFLSAVALIVVAVYLAIYFAVLASEPAAVAGGVWQAGLFVWVAGGTVLLIFGGSLYKLFALSVGGGAEIAAGMGGRRLKRGEASVEAQRLLNVVDEMAIASGVPTPPVYLLDGERSINAFAAGRSPTEAVVAVTRGALERLDREQLQGVVAHEFSHILNGDMRLNLRLIGILHGILLIGMTGEAILRGAGRSRSRDSGSAALVGLALFVIGYLGVFAGRLIQAAVSRQREFLADASAVQFTRNPHGIAGALKKIGGWADGSRLGVARAGEVAHFLFGEGVPPMMGFLSTHPPLKERIRRLEPGFEPDPGWGSGSVGRPAEMAMGLSDGTAGLAPGELSLIAGTFNQGHLAYARSLLRRVPRAVLDQGGEASGAKRVIYTLLLSAEAETRRRQLQVIERREGADARRWCEQHAGWMAEEGARLRLPLLNRLLPVLRELSPQGRIDFIASVDLLKDVDGKLELLEYTLTTILVDQLLEDDAWASRVASGRMVAKSRACAVLFSVLAHGGTRDERAAAAAFDAAMAESGFGYTSSIEPRSRLSLSLLDGALSRLAPQPPGFKRKLIGGCAAAVVDDGRVTVAEGELLRAVCERLGVPVPPLLPGQLLDGG